MSSIFKSYVYLNPNSKGQLVWFHSFFHCLFYCLLNLSRFVISVRCYVHRRYIKVIARVCHQYSAILYICFLLSNFKQKYHSTIYVYDCCCGCPFWSWDHDPTTTRVQFNEEYPPRCLIYRNPSLGFPESTSPI